MFFNLSQISRISQIGAACFLRYEVPNFRKGFSRFWFKNNKELYLGMKNKEFWKTVIQVIVTVLTALTTTLGVSSCM